MRAIWRVVTSAARSLRLRQEGIQALLELKRKGIYPEAKKYYASPCVRCVDTLKVLYPTADPEVILELAECDFGRLGK